MFICMCFSRDGKEELMQLNDEQRKQLQQRESSRFVATFVESQRCVFICFLISK